MDDRDKMILDRFYDVCASQVALLTTIVGDEKEAYAAIYEMLGKLLEQVEELLYPDDEEN